MSSISSSLRAGAHPCLDQQTAHSGLEGLESGLGQLGRGLVCELSWLGSPSSAPLSSFPTATRVFGVLGHSLCETQQPLLLLIPPTTMINSAPLDGFFVFPSAKKLLNCKDLTHGV